MANGQKNKSETFLGDQRPALSGGPRICLVTTVKDPGPGFADFLAYHRKVGFKKIYVFFDDPQDSAIPIATSVPGVEAIRCDEAHKQSVSYLSGFKQFGPHWSTEVMARQCLNTELAMQMARNEGFDWIFAIDADEAIICSGSIAASLSEIPAEVEEVIMLNHEAIPPSMDAVSPFADVTLFKRSPFLLDSNQEAIVNQHLKTKDLSIFCGYTRGKPVARLRSTIVPKGPHRFEGTSGPICSVRSKDLMVLHYINCGFSEYLRKYFILGSFGDFWFEKYKIPKGFHRDSRDAMAVGDFRRLEELYKEHVTLGKDLVQQFKREGILIEIDLVARLVLELRAERDNVEKAAS